MSVHPPVRQVQVTVDCADPRALSLFWNAVLGYQLPPPPPGFDDWDAFAASLPPALRNSASASEDPTGAGPRLFFQRVPEGKSAKNRFHLDVRAAPGLEGEERMVALEAEATRLIGLGASRVERHEPAPPMAGGHLVMRDPEGNAAIVPTDRPRPSGLPQAGHIVMLDPEGNEFCLD